MLSNIKSLLPIYQRKKIAYKINDLFGKKIVLSQKIKMRVSDKVIFFFGITNWEYRFQRTQQFAKELCKKGYTVFYIQPDFIPQKKVQLRSQDDFELRSTAFPEIFTVRLVADRQMFIYRDDISTQGRKLVKKSLDNLLRKVGITNPTFIVTHPFWHFIKDEFQQTPLFYDCMDNHAGFSENRKDIDEIEKKLSKAVDGVIVSSQFLKDKMGGYMGVKKIVLIRNAADFDDVHGIVSPDLEGIKRPIIGYVGEISEWFDERLFEKLVVAYQNYSFVLVGAINNRQIIKLSERYKNIYLEGEVAHREAYGYMQKFDVCLIPFKVNKLIRAVDPVKVYEYFVFGKPVVATKLPELAEKENLLYLTDSMDTFVRNVDAALHEPEGKRQERINHVQNNTWRNRTDALISFISS